MTDDEIIAHGEAAQHLLDSPEFVSAISGFCHIHLNALLSSADDDAEGREKHFRKMRVFEAVLQELKERAQDAKRLLARLEDDRKDLQQNDPTDPHSIGFEIP